MLDACGHAVEPGQWAPVVGRDVTTARRTVLVEEGRAGRVGGEGIQKH